VAIALGLQTPNVGTTGGAVCARLKSAGVIDVNPQHPKLLALLAAGLTEDEIVAAGIEARSRGKGFAYTLATAEGRRRDAANVRPMPSKPVGGLSKAGQSTAAAAHPRPALGREETTGGFEMVTSGGLLAGLFVFGGGGDDVHD